MKYVSSIEMPPDWIGMKCNKNDVPKVHGDNLKGCIRSTTMNWFPYDEHFILQNNMRLVQSPLIYVMDILESCLTNFAWVENKMPN